MPLKPRILSCQEILDTIDKPIFLNDLPLDTEEDRQRLNDLIITFYDKTDVMMNTPSCACRKTKYSVNLNVICEHCGNEVTANFTKIQSKVWFRAPESINAFLSPPVFRELYRALQVKKGAKGASMLTWLCNPNERDLEGSAKAQKLMKRFEAAREFRGLNCFIDNFDHVLEEFILPSIQERAKRAELAEFISRHRDRLFAEALPIPDKINFVVESTHLGTFYNKTIDSAVDAIYAAAALKDDKGPSVHMAEARCTRVMELLHSYWADFNRNTLSPKKGIARRAKYGQRIFYSMRDIVTSKHGIHKYDELDIPYSLGLVVMHTVVLRELCDEHNMSQIEAYNYIERHMIDMDPLILSILNKLVLNTPEGRGLVNNMTRYPSLRRGSSQTLRVVRFTDNSTQVSTLVLKAYNMDFDGDQTQSMIIPEKEVADKYMLLAPHYDIHSTDCPGRFSNSTELPDNTIQKLHNWMADEPVEIELDDF